VILLKREIMSFKEIRAKIVKVEQFIPNDTGSQRISELRKRILDLGTLLAETKYTIDGWKEELSNVRGCSESEVAKIKAELLAEIFE
jgi:hypothetical protein